MALRWLLVLAAVGGCSAPPERLPKPARVEAPPDAAPPAPVEIADPEPPPTPCGDLSWAECYTEGIRLGQRDAPDDVARGVVLLRALCEDGDHRRCFELDTTDERKAECQRRMLVSACAFLGEMYLQGEMSCPYDTACGAALQQMACLGGAGDPTCP